MNFLRNAVASFLSPWILPPQIDPSAHPSSAPLSLHLQSTSFQLVLELPTPLHIDCAAVNHSPIMSSSPILLHQLLVRRVKITASLFRRAGLRVEIHGLTVVFRPRASSDGFWSTREENSNKEKKRKAIFELDPQGAAVHMASENCMKDRTASNFVGTLIVSLLLRMLEVDVQNASIELHSNAVDSHSHHCCVVFGSLSTQEGSSLVGAVGERLVAISRSTERPVGRTISIKGLGLKLLTIDERESTNVAQGMCSQDAINSQRECRGFILLWKTVAVSIEFQNGHLTGVDAIFAETMVQMDVIKLQVFLAVARDFQGLPRVANPVPCLSTSQEIKRNSRHLWQKAIQKVTSGPSRRFKGVMQAGKLRCKYTHLYVAWIIETSVEHSGKLKGLSHLKNLRRKKERVKILEEDLLHMEQELPVEVIVFARYMARHKVEEIVKDKFTLLPRKCEKALFWLFAFWGAIKITFESLARYLKKSFTRFYFYFKRTLMYVGCLWVMQKFIQWVSSLGCRFLGKYFGRIYGSHKTDEVSKKTWTRLRNRSGISLFTSSFPTGSLTLLGSLQRPALQNNDENLIEDTERGIHFTWANFAVSYTTSPNKMGLQIICEHIEGVFFDSPVGREGIIGFSNGQISGVKFLSSNPAPGISMPENVNNNRKYGPLLAGSTFESEAEERYPSMLLEPHIGGNMNPFLLVCFEASHSISITTISEADFINCRLTMGCLECNLDYRSVTQLESMFSQYVGELIVDGQSSEHGLHESATFSSRRISEVFYARTMQFMSAIMIRRPIWLSAAVSGPKITFVFPFLESETTYADLINGAKLGIPALIISWEVFAATLWPPKVENDIHEQKKAGIRKTWLRSLPKPFITMEQFTTGHSEHLQIGSNGIFSLQGATLLLEDCNDIAMSQIVGPIHINGEFSLCRDHFISSVGAKDIMSASTMIVISSIPITMQLDEVEIMSQYSIAILRIFEKFSSRKLQYHSSEKNILVDAPCHEASTSRPLYFGLCVKVKIERFECIFIDERTHGNPVQGQEKSLDNSIPPKKLLTTDLKKAGSPKMDGKSVCITTKQLWSELSWGHGCELSLSSGLELADISIVKVENEQSKSKESANSPKAALLLINGREATVLSQFCIELLSATLILPWYPLQRSPKVGSQLQSTGNKTVAKLEIVNVYLTDGMLRGMTNRALSRVSATTNLLINIILSYECGTFTVSSKGGLIVVNTEALSLLFKTIQLLLSFLSILRSYDVHHICPSNLKEFFFEEKPCFEESPAWIPGKIQNQQQKVQQDEELNITPVKAYMDEQVFFNEFPWLTGGFSIEISKMCLLLIQTNITSTAKELRGLIFDVDAMLKLWDDLGGRFVDFQSTQFSICTVEVSAETSIGKDQRKNVPKFEVNDVSVGMEPLKGLGESSTSALDDAVESLQNIPSELESIDEEQDSEKKVDYILDNLRISSRIQRKSSGWSMPDDGWKGYCSFVGIDIGITTAELELIFALVMPLSTLSTQPRNNAQTSLNYVQPISQKLSSIKYELPDGSIVAVKDVHEHLYLAVEKTDNTYRLTGVLHYTLVGEQALFKVRHSNQQVNSSPSWFSLLSLGAKNADGECFRVHYNPGTGLADVSSIHDGSWELWQTLPHKNSARTDEVDIDQYDAHYEHWVHLINKKSKQGLSLANGSPVMVKRPGSLFKFKILGSPTELIDGEKISSFKENSEVLEIVEPTITVSAPKVEIHIGMAAITLLHETGRGKHIRPLLRGRLENTKSVIQILPFKTRVMGECKMIFEYFEAHVNRWSMVIQPINTEIFYRMRMTIDEKYQGSKTSSFLFVRLDQLDAIIDDYSLDMILFIVGELNLAGPYTLKHSPILASRCLVENHTGLQLCCTFLEKHMKGTMRIPGGKTDTFLIRNMTSRRDLSSTQVLSSVSLQLEDSEDGISLPVDISLRDARTIALRTRVGSKKGTRRSPGPIIVVDVSNESQNGIVVTVSPMVRVYNASGIMLQLRCRRSNNDSEGGVVVILEDGNAIDDSMGAFNALNMDGEKRKTLSSFNLGNYLLSVRPASSSVPGFCHTSADEDSKGIMFDWSEDIKGTKPFRISGFLEKLKYGLAKSIKGRSSQHSFGTVVCNTRLDESSDGNARSSHALHLFIQITRRFVPLSSIKDSDKDLAGGSGAILQEQLELVLLPTIRVYNLLESNIIVTLCSGLEGTAPQNSVYIEHGGKVFMYADLAEPSFSVEIQDLMLKSDNLNIGDWRNSVKSVDPTHTDGFKEVEMDISFKDNQYCAKLKLSRGDDGVLQMLVYTQYALRNMSSNPLMYRAARNTGSLWSSIYFWSRKKSIQWPEDENGNVVNPGMTVSLLQRSSIWLLRTVDRLSEISILDPESFSGTTELSIVVPHESGIIEQVLLGVMLDLSSAREMYPTCTIHISSRYVVLNESRDPIFVCQDGFQEDENAVSLLESGDRVSLTKRLFQGQNPVSSSGYSAYVGSDMIDPSNFFVRFSLQENQLDWSGPVCVNALGSFSLRICKNTETVKVLKSSATVQQSDKFQFVSVDIEDERPSLVIRFRMQSQFTVPYRIDNALLGLPIFFYQKGVGDCVTSIGPGKFAGYAWDDLTQPHKLVVFIPNAQVYNDIDLDKLSPWKSFQSTRQKGGFRLPMSLQSQLETMEQYNSDGLNSDKILDLKNIGYEIYADGRQRVLRVCEDLKSSKSIQIQSHISSPSSKVNLIVHNLGITLLEAKKQMAEVIDEGSSDNLEKWSPFISMRMRRILVEFSNTHKHALFQLKVQNLSVDEKWKGAPFAAMVRVHNADRFDISETVLHMAVIVSNQVSSPIYVKYSSILLQAIDLNIDEDTLMKLVPFYRYSLAESSSSRQIYFEHFEINPIKIVGSFLPGQPLGDYTSAQETLRALLHSLIKVPTIKGFTVQLNGVLLSHALLTFRQLAIKCVQHYSWYALRAVYIAKGSKLLPPAFTSLFDDSAASSLDVFFDPSNGSVDLQGLTLGMFNLLSEGLNRRGFSGTSRYIGDLERMMKTAGSNILFAILTEVSDNVLKGAETGGIDGMVNGFRRGILNISMEPSFLRSAAVKGGLNRRIKLTRNAGVDEPYIEGYLQAMLDTRFKQDYLRVKVVDDEVLLKNLPPNSMLVEEILGCVKGFLGQEGFLVGETSARPMQSLRRLQEENEFKKLVPAAVALGEQLFVIFAVRALRNEARTWFKWGVTTEGNNISARNEHQESKESSSEVEKTAASEEGQKTRRSASNVLLSFVLSSAMAYIDGRLCRHIPNTLARRVVSGFLLSFVE